MFEDTLNEVSQDLALKDRNDQLNKANEANERESNLFTRCCRKQYTCCIVFLIALVLFFEVLKIIFERNYDTIFFETLTFILSKYLNITEENNF